MQISKKCKTLTILERILNISGMMFCILLITCSRSENHQVLEDKIFVLHDDVMPKMEYMTKLKKRLYSEIRTDSSHVDFDQALVTADSLEYADSLMWAWMYQYKPLENIIDSCSKQEIDTYLKKQLRYVTEVNERMVNSMAAAEEMLGT